MHPTGSQVGHDMPIHVGLSWTVAVNSGLQRFRKPVLYPLSYEDWMCRIASCYRTFWRSA